MEKYIIMIAATSLVMSGVILGLILFNRLLSDRYAAKWRYYIWLIVLGGLLIPFRPDITLPFKPVSVSLGNTEQSTITALIENTIANKDYNSVQSPAIDSRENISAEPAMKSNATPKTMIIFLVWLTGVTLSLALCLHRHKKFISMTGRWETDISDCRILSLLQQIQAELRIPQKIQVKKCSAITSPMLAGFIKPVILLPDKLIHEEELVLILKHELIHYKRKDLWMNLLVVFTTAIHWFNPVVHIMSSEIRNDCEASCDEAVIGNTGVENRRIYGEAVISFTGAQKAVKTALSTNFYGGKNTMKKRIISIMNTSRKRKEIAVLCVALIIALTFMSGFVFAVIPSANITTEKAWEVALTKTGGGTVVKCELDYLGDKKAGIKIYEIEIINGSTKYELEIGVNDSVIYSYEESTSTKDRSAALPFSTDITAEEAIGIALTKTGAGEATKWELSGKDANRVYKIEIVSETLRYTMDVRASDGEIQNYKEKEVKSDKINKGTQSVQPILISAEKANEIALERAGGGRIEECELDYEKGIWIYELELILDKTEYEAEINAETGEILKFKIDD